MAHERQNKILKEHILCRFYPDIYHNHRSRITRCSSSSTKSLLCYEQRRDKHDARSPEISRAEHEASHHNYSAYLIHREQWQSRHPKNYQVSKSRDPNTKAQSTGRESCSATHMEDSHSTDITTENRVTVAECTKEIPFISRHVMAEGC